MRITMLLILTLTLTGAQAGDDMPEVTIQQVDLNFDVQQMAGPGIKIKRADELTDSPDSDNPDYGDEMPSIRVMHGYLAQSGLTEEVIKMDAVDRDRLYLRARSLPAKDLASRYPKLSAERLAKYHALVNASKKR